MTLRLSESEVEERMGQLTGWTLKNDQLQSIRKFKDFIAAIGFVNQLVEPSEALGHHPDLEISYNKVTINLTTHDAEGLTDKDFLLAQTISGLH